MIVNRNRNRNRLLATAVLLICSVPGSAQDLTIGSKKFTESYVKMSNEEVG